MALRKLYTLPWGDLLMLLGVGMMIVGIGVKLNQTAPEDKVKVTKIEVGPENLNKIININTADIRQLIDLPGIGEKMAQRIIDYRMANGLFKTKESIKGVRGIGDKTYEALKNKISL